MCSICYSCYSCDISYPVFLDYKDISCYFCEICDLSEALLCLSLCKSRILLNLLVVLFLRYLQLSLNISWNHFFSLKLRKKLRCKFMLLRSIMGIAQIFTTPLSRIFQKRLEHKNQTKYYRRMTRKPQSHFKILIYRTRVIIYKRLYCTHVISSVSQGGSIETLLSLGMFGCAQNKQGSALSQYPGV